MPTHALSYADIQRAINTTHQVLESGALTPVILALAQQSQVHNVSPEHALMMLLKYQGDSDEH